MHHRAILRALAFAGAVSLIVAILGLGSHAQAGEMHRHARASHHRAHWHVAVHGHAKPGIRLFGNSEHLPVVAPDLVAEARRFLGRSNPTPYREEWCRDFINLIADRLGIHLANQSHRAIDALWLGPHVKRPKPGDLAIVGRHHVTIVAGISGRKIIGLGGNQGRRVKYSQYSLRSIIAFVRI